MFAREEPVRPEKLLGATTFGRAQIYRCEETGAERRYGIE